MSTWAIGSDFENKIICDVQNIVDEAVNDVLKSEYESMSAFVSQKKEGGDLWIAVCALTEIQGSSPTDAYRAEFNLTKLLRRFAGEYFESLSVSGYYSEGQREDASGRVTAIERAAKLCRKAARLSSPLKSSQIGSS